MKITGILLIYFREPTSTDTNHATAPPAPPESSKNGNEIEELELVFGHMDRHIDERTDSKGSGT